MSFGVFLSYKIESILPDKDDISFSLNALFPKFDSTDKLTLDITEGRMDYLKGDSTGKGGILRSLGLDTVSPEELKNILFRKICGKYIYCIDINEYGLCKFNVCTELPTVDGSLRKTAVALIYRPDSGEMEVLTVT